MISAGDHEGPQPPEKQLVSIGKSKTSTVTTGFAILQSSCQAGVTAPVGHTRAQMPQPAHRLSSTS